MVRLLQGRLFAEDEVVERIEDATSSTFVNNMTLPVHRWFRYSAGFSAEWAESTIRSVANDEPVRVFDPFAGSGTSLLAAEAVGVASIGIDAHPFIARVTRAKLAWRSDPDSYLDKTTRIEKLADTLQRFSAQLIVSDQEGQVPGRDQLTRAPLYITTNRDGHHLASTWTANGDGDSRGRACVH